MIKNVLILSVICSIVFSSCIFSIMPDSYGATNLTIYVQKEQYFKDEIIHMRGSIFQPQDDYLNLKIYDRGAKLIWSDKIQIQIDDIKFNYSLDLSNASELWINPGIYILLAEIDGTIASAKFKFNLEKREQNENLTEQQSKTTQVSNSNQTITIDIDQLADRISQKILSSYDFSSNQYQQSEIDVDELVDRISQKISMNHSSVILPSSPPPPQYNSELLYKENVEITEKNIKLLAENRELINQSNILQESIENLNFIIDMQANTMKDMIKNIAELKAIIQELFN